jgi:hypothetical protein
MARGTVGQQSQGVKIIAGAPAQFLCTKAKAGAKADWRLQFSERRPNRTPLIATVIEVPT